VIGPKVGAIVDHEIIETTDRDGPSPPLLARITITIAIAIAILVRNHKPHSRLDCGNRGPASLDPRRRNIAAVVVAVRVVGVVPPLAQVEADNAVEVVETMPAVAVRLIAIENLVVPAGATAAVNRPLEARRMAVVDEKVVAAAASATKSPGRTRTRTTIKTITKTTTITITTRTTIIMRRITTTTTITPCPVTRPTAATKTASR
jgi:hypothetical protein